MSLERKQLQQGLMLETLNWSQAEKALKRSNLVVIPLGAAAKEHGLHLPLNNDALIAQWLSEEVCKKLPVVIAPLINTSYYPAFSEYPGSISLRAKTACNMLVDICHSLASHGPSRFYVLNTGVSTETPLLMAKSILESENISLAFLRLSDAFAQLDANQFAQQYGSHADEYETSLMLHIASQAVDMTRAVDDGSEGIGPLSRTRGQGTWSESGVYGQATLANANKGKLVAKALLQIAVSEIEAML